MANFFQAYTLSQAAYLLQGLTFYSHKNEINGRSAKLEGLSQQELAAICQELNDAVQPILDKHSRFLAERATAALS